MYTETSGIGSNKTAELKSYCIDASAVTNPALGFYYHMYGPTQGTLQVNINGDSAWSMTGDQGDQWYQAQVDLSAYAGGNIFVQFFGFTGTSFTSDMAIDEVSVSAGLVAGCTDPIAINYDSTAVIDDGSCLYVMGCTDPAYANYDPLATMDDGSCAGCLGNSVAIEMFDSFGDGWNGNTYGITDSTGAVVATGGLVTGAYGVDSLCLPNGCYTITVGGGAWQSEVSFNFGSLIGVGVGTYTNVCFPVTGCTDTAATNYSPAATVDDGSCFYACAAAPYVENFDNGSLGSFTTANLGTGTYPGWFLGSSTPSSGTGPQSGDVSGSGQFAYIETSGLGGPYSLSLIHI